MFKVESQNGSDRDKFRGWIRYEIMTCCRVIPGYLCACFAIGNIKIIFIFHFFFRRGSSKSNNTIFGFNCFEYRYKYHVKLINDTCRMLFKIGLSMIARSQDCYIIIFPPQCVFFELHFSNYFSKTICSRAKMNEFRTENKLVKLSINLA